MSAIETLYEHAVLVYETFQDEATLDSDGTLVFTGSKVETFRKAGVANTYYTPIFDALSEMGCIEQIRRGASHQPSVIALHKPPVLEELQQIYVKVLTKPTKPDTVQRQIDDLARRLPDIDLKSFILSLDQRLSAIEARLDKIEKRQGRK